MNDFSALERRAGVLTLQGMESSTIHVGMFMQVLTAWHAGNEQLANFYAQRFPPDVRRAFDSWMAQNPFENPKAAPHPFVPELYEIRGSREAAELNKKAETHLSEARNAGSISGQYLANTVLFAAVLFFANAAGKFEQQRVRLVALAFAFLVFSVAVVRMLMLPF
ncbi:MAG: hypothetical protein EOO38_12460 [Cytophagaceae bacterium]|nr:MAG: hypothetical protein EOO38_12460 [Cytophagaceae bacterium]